MNKMPTTPKRYFWIILITLLAACATLPPQPTSQPTTYPTGAMTSAPTFTPILETPTALPTPSPTPLPLFPLNGYVMLFTKDGDLYFQDGNNSPVKLTHVGETSNDPKFSDEAELSYLHPMISDDNQKVIFSRSDGNIYSININRTQEQIIIPTDWLTPFNAGTKIGIVQFIPGTHRLLLETHLCSLDHRPPCANSIFIADTDAGEIKKLADFSLNYHFYDSAPRNIAVSPNGKMLAVGALDGTQILALNGKVIRRNVLPYKPNMDNIFFPSLSWLPDSSGLIVAIPDKVFHTPVCDNLTAHTLWRYTIATNTAIQIPLDPPPMMHTFQISPDGNWVVYGGYCQPLLYRGNLANGQTQVFGEDDNHPNFYWSSDSKHIIYLNAIVISFDDPLVYIGWSSVWIDANHFLYADFSRPQERISLGKIDEKEIHHFALPFPSANFFMLKPKQ